MTFVSQVLHFDSKLHAHRVQSAGLQFILEIANNGERSAEIQRLMTAFTTSGIQKDRYILGPAERLDPPNELVAGHGVLSDENVRTQRPPVDC